MADVEDDQSRPEKRVKTAGERAAYNLRAARKAYQAVDWADDRKTQFLMEEAHVLALLELADVLRNGKTAQDD